MSAQVLGADLDMVHDPGLRQVEMEHAGQHDEVQLVRVVLEIVHQVRHDVPHEVSRSVAFPVGNHAVAPVALSNFLIMLLFHFSL